MKALIFGAGGVGCVYGYILYKAGLEVTAVCRTNYEAVKERGIFVKSQIFGENCHYTPFAARTVAEAAKNGPFDYIIVASKAFPGTAEMIKEAVTPGQTAIVLAQNGIAIEEDYVKLYPGNTIISGAVYLPVTQTAPGIVEMAALERFEIGPYPAKNASPKAKAQTQQLSDLWKAGGATAPVFEDVQPVRWIKVAINVGCLFLYTAMIQTDSHRRAGTPLLHSLSATMQTTCGHQTDLRRWFARS
jgi:2-dehydropantoate 2-reductase